MIGVPFIVTTADYGTGKCTGALGVYRGKSEKQIDTFIVGNINGTVSATCDGKTLTVTFENKFSFIGIYY